MFVFFHKNRVGSVPGFNLRAATAALALVLAGGAHAEVSEVRLSRQFGLPYLPLVVAAHENLIEKHAQAQGVAPLKVTWTELASGTGLTEALLSDSIDFAGGGIGPLLLLWDRTKGGVKAVGGLDGSIAYLVSNNPAVKSIEDFGDGDRIALPGVKVSAQAQWLQLAAAKKWGADQYDRLDRLTVTLPHPEAAAAVISGRSEINAHFATAPFSYQEIASPNVHVVTTSDDILGGPATNTFLYAKTRFRDDNPKVFRAVFDALKEAHELIAADKAEAARIYVEQTGSKQSVEEVLAILEQPGQRPVFGVNNTYVQAEFLNSIGTLKRKPESWKDYVFPELHDQPGS